MGLGIGRFAYALILPDMKASLAWSYSQAGFMNTANAAGYLLGAIAAAWTARRVGEFACVMGGTLACVAGLAVSAATGNFAILTIARLVTGSGAAIAFVSGGALAAAIAQRRPSRSAFLLGLFYVGPGMGIVVSGVLTPVLLGALGPGSWWAAWAMLAAVAVVAAVVLSSARAAAGLHATPGTGSGKAFPIASALPVLVGYAAFGVGYIAYMTFMIAFVRDGGAGPALQASFWAVLGIGAIAWPWVWSFAIARMTGGRAVGFLTAVTALGALLPLLSLSIPVLFLSALVFGSAFFAVVAATTAFVRRNLPRQAWPAGIGLMTVSFGLGQTFGPVGMGAITDLSGGLSAGMWASVAVLALGAALAALQPDLHRADAGQR
ncbi:YbfB/YjiJ family MFS transporter [Nostoc sp. NIES-2111]